MATSSLVQPTTVAAPTPSQSRSLKSKDVQQGNILWLAPYSETLASFRTRGDLVGQPVLSVTKQCAAEQGVYDHPILVLSRSEDSPYCIRFLILTSFNGKSITKRFSNPESRHEWLNYLPVFPAEHPLHGGVNSQYQPLHLKDGAISKRPSYIKISEFYEMDWRDAQPQFHRLAKSHSKVRLNAASLQSVLMMTARVAGDDTPKKPYGEHPLADVDSVEDSSTPLADLASKVSSELRKPKTPNHESEAADRTLASINHSKFDPGVNQKDVVGNERDPLIPLRHQRRPISGAASSQSSGEWFRPAVKVFALASAVGLLTWFAVSLLEHVDGDEV